MANGVSNGLRTRNVEAKRTTNISVQLGDSEKAFKKVFPITQALVVDVLQRWDSGYEAFNPVVVWPTEGLLKSAKRPIERAPAVAVKTPTVAHAVLLLCHESLFGSR